MEVCLYNDIMNFCLQYVNLFIKKLLNLYLDRQNVVDCFCGEFWYVYLYIWYEMIVRLIKCYFRSE